MYIDDFQQESKLDLTIFFVCVGSFLMFTFKNVAILKELFN